MSAKEKKVIQKRAPSFGLACLALGAIIVSLFMCIMVWKTVSIQVGLLVGGLIVMLISGTLGHSFNDQFKMATKSITESNYGLWFFIMIGAVVASWMMAGTVPAIIYYGLGFITPTIFLPAGLLLCSATAYATGTSWGTVGTVGIALIGIGQGLGIPLPVTAGMIVSGAAFGDKMSPVSDTPNLSCIAAGADLYKSISAMFKTMTPAYIIALVCFTVLGFKYGGGTGNLAIIEETRTVIAANFNLNPIVMLPIVVLLFLNYKKFPSLPAMVIGVTTGLVIAVIFQHASIPAALEAINSGFKIATGSTYVDPILNRGGIQSMMWTFSLAFIALSLGGILDGVGYMTAIVEKFISIPKTVGGFTLTVMVTSILATAAFGEAYLSYILNGNLYRKEFDKRGLDRAMLARVISEGGLMPAPLMPWTSFGAFVLTTLGVSGLQFAPYAFLNYLCPIVSVLMTYMGIGIIWNNKKNKGIRKLAEADLSNEPVFTEV